MKSFFNSIARETLARENIPEGKLRLTEQQQSIAATSDTVKTYSVYPTLPSDDLDMEEDNHLEVMMRKMEQMEVALWNGDAETESTMVNKKEIDKGYV